VKVLLILLSFRLGNSSLHQTEMSLGFRAVVCVLVYVGSFLIGCSLDDDPISLVISKTILMKTRSTESKAQ
jgi:hypothetical protein